MTTYKYIGGRLGNTLYYVLQMFIRRSNGEACQYLCSSDYNYRQLCRLGLEDMITVGAGTPGISMPGYAQQIGRDYTEDDVNAMIRSHMLDTDILQQAIRNVLDAEHAMAITIRNTDYLSRWPHIYCFFDRRRYIIDSLAYFRDKSLDNLHVFSDDVDCCQREYHDIFEKTFKNVVYERPPTPEDGLVQLASFRHKILFNSTFSVWAAYIGNVLYPDSYADVVCPPYVIATDPYWNIYNDKWHKTPIYPC